MPKTNFICRYCDHRFSDFVYSENINLICPMCKSRITVKDLEKEREFNTDPFGYKYDNEYFRKLKRS